VAEGKPQVGLSEDEVKRAVEAWLESLGWKVSVAWGRVRGIDILATKGDQRWVIEAKGSGSLNPMRVNYFVSMLGELLQRMDDSNARYSIALPDMGQFRGLWERLPPLAKSRTGISALFVHASGGVQVSDAAISGVRSNNEMHLTRSAMARRRRPRR
jgi:hypothetical protein